MDTHKKIGILGVGNTLLQDEGFGPICVERLEQQYLIPDHVRVLDGGTAGILLSPFIEAVDVLYIIDTVNLSSDAGTIHCFTDQEIHSKDIQTRLSPHQVGLVEIIDLCKLRDKAPDHIEMLTTVPQELSVGMGLSDTLEPVVDTMLALLVERLKAQGVLLKKKKNADR